MGNAVSGERPMSSLWDLIRADHRTIEALFARVRDAADAAERERLFEQLQRELKRHARAEEAALYPELKQHRETKLEVGDALRDHAEMVRLAHDVATTRKGAPDFLRKCRDLQQLVERHVREEEDTIIPAAEAAIHPERAAQMARRFQAEKQAAAT
jgi:hemerythrin superfamily protein